MEGALTALFQQTNALVLVAVGVFTRVSAVMFFLPGIGERSVPMRVRLAIALSIAVLLSPVIVALEPRSPETVAALASMLGAEALCGLLIGFAFRITIFALQTAGTIAAQHLSVAQMFGAGVAPEPEPTIATMLGMAGI
ncbi:MAG: flagellar biosynthetic protein FliR, partial [Pseudomonadota bacterium]